MTTEREREKKGMRNLPLLTRNIRLGTQVKRFVWCKHSYRAEVINDTKQPRRLIDSMKSSSSSSEGIGQIYAVTAHRLFFPGAQPARVPLDEFAPEEILLVDAHAAALPARLPPRAPTHRTVLSRVKGTYTRPFLSFRLIIRLNVRGRSTAVLEKKENSGSYDSDNRRCGAWKEYRGLRRRRITA